MRGAGKSLCHIRFVRVDAFKPHKVLIGTESNLRRLEGYETVDRAVDAEEPALVVHLDDGKSAFRAIRGGGDIAGSLLYGFDLLMPKLEGGMDDDAIEYTRVFLQDFFQIAAKRAYIGGVILGIPQHLNLLEQAAAVGEDGKCKILINVKAVVDDPAFVGLADADDEGMLSRGTDFPGFPARLAEYLQRQVPDCPFQRFFVLQNSQRADLGGHARMREMRLLGKVAIVFIVRQNNDGQNLGRVLSYGLRALQHGFHRLRAEIGENHRVWVDVQIGLEQILKARKIKLATLFQSP